MTSQEVYDIFFNAIRNREGKIIKLRIDGEKKPIFVLNNNPFNKRLVFALDDFSIHQIKTFLGQVVSVEKVLDISQASEDRKDSLQEELKKLSQKFSEDMKGKFLERLKARQISKKEVRAKKEIKIKREIKVRRPRSMAK